MDKSTLQSQQLNIQINTKVASLSNNSFDIKIKNTPDIKLSFDNFVLEDAPIYTEEYNISPNDKEDQILFTNNKKMINNIIFYKIPYAEVSNEAGGYTASINS